MHSPVCKSRSTKVSARVDSERQEKIHSKMGKEFCNVLIRDHSEFSLKKWGKQQENEFQRIKANFRSNLRINNVPVLFQFVKKYTTTVKARDNIYRKWEQREMNGITPQ